MTPPLRCSFSICWLCLITSSFFFFNDTATTEIYTLSLHDALPISADRSRQRDPPRSRPGRRARESRARARVRSEEHTSELQSPCNLVCRLLLEKKKIEAKTGPDYLDIKQSMDRLKLHTICKEARAP